MAEALLRDCPHLTILATSCEALRVPGEVAWRVPWLSTLDPSDLPPLPEVLDYKAIELFVNAASAAHPPFALEYQRVLATVRAQANGPGFATAWVEGQQMSLDQAVEYALSG